CAREGISAAGVDYW
nr:immunoglobulin heavy chain junction region [Macaca mulatta]MOX58762.1 immunoglobulin heavy chain junction region [Macaca mulatta]MOX58893.1 immunoglobulin heavy chain junction region [Macaca mulatta]MOX59922.1 immunoglobulin heavy chain junction region [Macaca mulatta]MOX60311.1 immunoglobulin heavy chain junction region [Macaca mulatta]